MLFTSTASDLLLPGEDTNGARDLFIKDLATEAITRVSTDASGGEQNLSGSSAGVWSPDGTKVLFSATADNLVGAGNDTNNNSDLFLKDIATGAISRVNVTQAGDEANGFTQAPRASEMFSRDGNKIAFVTQATNLGALGGDTVVIKDLTTGALTVVAKGFDPVFSPDGTMLLFKSTTGGGVSIYDLTTQVITRISADANGVQLGGGGDPQWSPDGTKIVINSNSALVPEDTNGTEDAYVKTIVLVPEVDATASTAAFLMDDPDNVSWVDTVSPDGHTDTTFQWNTPNGTVTATGLGFVYGGAGTASRPTEGLATQITISLTGATEDVILRDLRVDASLLTTDTGGSESADLFWATVLEGETILDGGNENDQLLGLDGDDTINGGGGNDIISGGEGEDVLLGGSGKDKLNGGAGMDTLNGGRSKDVLTGGADRDFFDFNSIKDSKKGGQRDTIKDFKRGNNVVGDEIDLSTIDAKKGGGNQKFKFIGKKDFHDKKGELRYEDKGNKVIVQGDTNGDGKADFEILVMTGALGKGDFVL